MEDSLIPIVLAILAAIIGAVTQGKKKPVQHQQPQGDEEFDPTRPMEQFPDAEVIIRKIMREITPEPEPQMETVPKGASRQDSEDLVIPDELKRQRELLMSLEGLSNVPTVSSFVEDEIHDGIAEGQIGDAVEEVYKPFEIAGVGQWEPRKAVILSEILNRRVSI
jgi:hypothetical protein